MKNSWWRDEFKVGLMAIVGLIILSTLLIRSSHWRFNTGGYRVKVSFDYVGGLLKNAPVHMYGVDIGKVASVKLAGDKVEVTLQLNTEVPIREDYQVLIDILGLVGEKYVEIINGPVGNPVTKDDPLQGTDPISIGHVLVKADEITTKTLKTIDFIQTFVSTNEKEIHTGVGELSDFIREAKNVLKKTMSNVDILLSRINRLTEATESDVCEIIANSKTFVEKLNSDRERVSLFVNDAMDDLDQLMAGTTPVIEKSVENLQETSEELLVSTRRAGQHIENLNNSLSQLVAQFSEITTSGDQKLQEGLDNFGRSATALNETLDRIDGLVAEIENGRGTLGKLIADESGYGQFNAAMVAGKSAVEDVSDITSSLNNKLRFLDEIDTKKEYGLSYNHLSRNLQNQFMLSLSCSNTYSYMAGLSVREGKLTYDFQVGRKFGDLMARVGSIRSKAGIGLDYWPFSDHLRISLQGIDITDRQPEVELGVDIKLLGGWYLIFGAEDLTGSEVSFNFGARIIFGN